MSAADDDVVESMERVLFALQVDAAFKADDPDLMELRAWVAEQDPGRQRRFALFLAEHFPQPADAPFNEGSVL